MRARQVWLVGLAALAVTVAGCSCNNIPVEPKLKELGVPCAADDECELTLCDALGAGGEVCQKPCSEGCDSSEVCTGLGDDRFACAEERAGLCQSCTTSADCAYPADECLELSGERFCGRDCAFDGKCPESFRCAEGRTVTGAVVASQCQPMSGTCQCTQASAGQKIPCENQNNAGTCTGTRTCEPTSGYAACTARIPGAEVCNGIDDDCDGQTDEELGDETCGLGACQRTVARCANSVAQVCEPGDAGVEDCNGVDDDCDGPVDEDFDLQASVQHCGACNSLCAPDFAIGACVGGQCTIGQCLPNHWDVNRLASDGCEYACTYVGAEACNLQDDDCDGLVDELFDTQTNPSHCGACNNACTPPHATGACDAGGCAIGRCDPGRGDCNATYSDGCETNTQTSTSHCGGCGLPCALPNATPYCDGGSCGIAVCDLHYDDCNGQVQDGCEVSLKTDVANCGGCDIGCSFPNAVAACTDGGCTFTCLPNFWDLDGAPANGCEYACTKISELDLPELSFADSNCDGIDGEVANSVFVSITGADSNPGTRALPLRTVTAAVNQALDAGLRDVLVTAGPFYGTATVSGGKSLYGGYDATTWARSLTSVTSLSNGNPALEIAGSDGGTVIQLLHALGAGATGTAATGYGVKIVDSAGVSLESVTILAGNGTDGPDGQNGATGAPGGNGGKGNPGCEDSSGTCSSCDRPAGGLAGTSACSRRGGVGGMPGKGGSAGDPGGVGEGGTVDTPGGLGRPCCQGNTTAPSQYNGKDGADGGVGTSGSSGGGVGATSAAGYVLAVSTAGGLGIHGKGGGAGGGGGGGDNWCNSYGSSGGGGGGGGCGGLGGGRGLSGGASIGLFLHASSVTATNVSITTGTGGRGGNGGTGGLGGGGGLGGAPGDYGGDGEQDNGSNGGKGGAGGRGGRGGAGGAGGGGPSVGVLKGAGSTFSGTGLTYTLGQGGLGGTSVVGDGQTGLVAQEYP